MLVVLNVQYCVELKSYPTHSTRSQCNNKPKTDLIYILLPSWITSTFTCDQQHRITECIHDIIKRVSMCTSSQSIRFMTWLKQFCSSQFLICVSVLCGLHLNCMCMTVVATRRPFFLCQLRGSQTSAVLAQVCTTTSSSTTSPTLRLSS